MFSSIFGTAAGLLDRRFVLGLLLPVLAFRAGALAATARVEPDQLRSRW